MIEEFKLTSTEIEKMLEAGSMAPSGGNAQPWLVKVSQNTIEITLDSKRSSSFIDVGKSASLIALGCFVENVDITAQSLRLDYDLENDFSDLKKIKVVLKFVGRKFEHKDSRAYLSDHIKNRMTNRQLYDGTTLDEKTIEEIKNMREELGEILKIDSISKQAEKTNLARILGRADFVRMHNSEAFDQMIEEFRWTPKEVVNTNDGLDLQTLEMPKNLGKVFSLIHKNREILDVLPKHLFQEISKPLIEGCSHAFCISASSEFKSEILFQAGRLIERVWLKVTSLSLAFQPWTISTFFILRTSFFEGEGFSDAENGEVREIAEELKQQFKLDSQAIPLFIFRVSKAKQPTARSLKRHWKEFTQFA